MNQLRWCRSAGRRVWSWGTRTGCATSSTARAPAAPTRGLSTLRGANHIYVYTSNSTSSVCALWQPVLWIPAPTTQSAIKATVSTPKTQLLVELWKVVASLQISLENTLASAHPLSASSSWRANAGLVTCRDPARTESKWRKAATTKFCAERIPVLRSWASLSFLVPVTSATNFLGYSVGFYYPMPHDSSPRRRRLSLRRIKESQTQVHLNWVIQLYVFPVEQRIAPAKM